jgi:hypothetical protein
VCRINLGALSPEERTSLDEPTKLRLCACDLKNTRRKNRRLTRRRQAAGMMGPDASISGVTRYSSRDRQGEGSPAAVWSNER